MVVAIVASLALGCMLLASYPLWVRRAKHKPFYYKGGAL